MNIDKNYISSIDGLRALAVIAVMVFHLNPNYLPGGFTGVDIFFVISGYVVARSLSVEKFTTFRGFIKEFYKRRLVRIYPALLACLLITSFIVIFFIPKFYVSKSIDETGLAAFFGVSNFILALDTESYFSLSTDFNPFVHTWSLGVEEQFYFIFPFIFYFWIGNRFKIFMPLLFVISLCLSYYYIQTDLNKAYYYITSRFWELASGVLLFQYHYSVKSAPKLTRNKQNFFLITGLLLVTIGTVFSNKNHFPLPWGLAPVVGTILLLHGFVLATGSRSIIVRFFSMKVSSHLGKLSYSLYLWHWPIFTFFRWTVGLQSITEYILAISSTYLFSFASYRLIELRLSKSNILKAVDSKKLIMSSIGTIVLLAFLTSTGFKKQSLLSVSVTSDKEIWSPYRSISEPSAGKSLSGRTLYIIGDSHAGAYSAMLKMLSEETGIRIKKYAQAGCGVTNMLTPVLVVENGCSHQLNKWLNEISEEITSKDVLFFATLKLPRSVYQSSVLPGDLETTMEEMASVESTKQRNLALEESQKLLSSFSAKNPLIIIDAPKPIFNYIAFRCADWYTSTNPVCSAGYEVSRILMEKMRAPVLENIEKLKSQISTLVVWDALPLLCGKDVCSLFRNEKPIYFDSDHLSGFGNSILYEDFKEEIFKNVR